MTIPKAAIDKLREVCNAMPTLTRQLAEARQQQDRMSDCLDRIRVILEDRAYSNRMNQLQAIRDAMVNMWLPDTKQDEKILILENLLAEKTQEVERLKAEIEITQEQFFATDEALCKIGDLALQVSSHFNDDGSLKGDGKWRMEEIRKYCWAIVETEKPVAAAHTKARETPSLRQQLTTLQAAKQAAEERASKAEKDAFLYAGQAGTYQGKLTIAAKNLAAEKQLREAAEQQSDQLQAEVAKLRSQVVHGPATLEPGMYAIHGNVWMIYQAREDTCNDLHKGELAIRLPDAKGGEG